MGQSSFFIVLFFAYCIVNYFRYRSPLSVSAIGLATGLYHLLRSRSPLLVFAVTFAFTARYLFSPFRSALNPIWPTLCPVL